MIISELIKTLETVKKEQGDLEVTMVQDNNSNESRLLGKVSVEQVKPRYPDVGERYIFAFVKRLKKGGWGRTQMFDDDYQKEIEARLTQKVVFLNY